MEKTPISRMDRVEAALAELAESQKETERQVQQTNRVVERLGEKIEALAQESRKTEEEIKALVQQSNKTEEEIRALTQESRKTKEEMRNLAAQLRRTDRDFNGKWGSLIEAFVEGVLVSLLQERNIAVTQLAETTGIIDTATRRRLAEFDMIAVNGEEVVVVEVKTTLNVRKVNEFIAKLIRFKGWFSQYKDKKVYGAIAFIKADASSEVYAQKNKLFAIRAVGEGAAILNESGFEPRTF